MQAYIKKPVIVRAFKWDGELNTLRLNTTTYEFNHDFNYGTSPNGGIWLTINTKEGAEECPEGDMVIKGVEGEFYPCDPKIFKKTYKKSRIIKYFKYDGKISTLLQHLNEPDIAFSFNVKYPGKKQGKDPDIHGKASGLILNNESGSHKVPVGSILYKDTRSEWHIKK